MNDEGSARDCNVELALVAFRLPVLIPNDGIVGGERACMNEVDVIADILDGIALIGECKRAAAAAAASALLR